jgi:hypothetical protein
MRAAIANEICLTVLRGVNLQAGWKLLFSPHGKNGRCCASLREIETLCPRGQSHARPDF